MVGNALAPVGLAFAILRLTGSKSDLGIVLAARQVPQLTTPSCGSWPRSRR
jgi:hypothetical protein